MNSSLKIAHISDPHLSSLGHIKWGDLLNKRILGYLSWKLKRRNSHSREVLSRTLADLARHQAGHLIISGDFTHLGTENECRETEAWLTSTGQPRDISIVPGNHDHYVAADFTGTTGRWLAYMQSDPGEHDNAHGFPYLRVRGPVAFIGLSTAIPTAPFFATGKLGNGQLQRLRHLLDTSAQRGLYRIVVLHHSPHWSSFRRRLIDADALLSTLTETGAELLVHGHGHRQMQAELEAGDHSIPVFGVPSASANYKNPDKKAGYNIYEVTKTAAGWLTRVRSFVLDRETQNFEPDLDRELKYLKPLSVTTGGLSASGTIQGSMRPVRGSG